jgi:O-antigen ligase
MSHQEQAQFSLLSYYRGKRLPRMLDALLVILLMFLLLYAPLPFGSVEYTSRAVLKGVAALCFLVWMIKLIYGGNREVLHLFREIHRRESEMLGRRPFFHRHYGLTRLARILTLGRFPRKNIADNLVTEEEAGEDGDLHPRKFYSFFGYPVRNTGIEFIMLAFLVLLCVQMTPLPSFVVGLFSPAALNLYAGAARGTQTVSAFMPLSLDAFTTLERTTEIVAYFLIFLTVVNNIRTRTLFWIILYTIFIASVFQGIYGLYEFLSGSHHIFGYQKRLGLDSASGTFINRNHFAAYLELSIPLMVALVVGRVQQLRAIRGNILVRIAHALETEGSQILILLFMIVLVAVSLIFSLSRSGISFGLASLLTFLFLYWRARHELSRKSYLILGIGGTIAMAVWIGLNPVLQRFLHLSENWAEGARLQVWTDTFNIFLHFPLTGTGVGTFPQIFPMYRSFVYNSVFREAHNDYVQLLAESGIVFVFLIILLGDSLVSRLRQVLGRSLRRLEVIQLGAFCSLISLALHSVTDFSLQIPAIAVQGAVITGLLFSHYHGEAHGNR